MTRLLVLCGLAAVLVACQPTPAVVVDISADKVVVQQRMTTPPRDVHEKARHACAMHGRVPVPMSKQCLDEYCLSSNHLFACAPSD